MNFPIAFKAMDCKFYAVRVRKIRFSGARKPVFLKASSGERCVPRNFVHFYKVHVFASSCTSSCTK